MNLKLLVESSSKMTLIVIIFHEQRMLIDALEILYYTKLFSFIDFLIVLKEFTYDLLISNLV